MNTIMTIIFSVVATSMAIFIWLQTSGMANPNLVLDCKNGQTHASKYLYDEYGVKSVECGPDGQVVVSGAVLILTKAGR